LGLSALKEFIMHIHVNAGLWLIGIASLVWIAYWRFR
jgi:hypothetical protein